MAKETSRNRAFPQPVDAAVTPRFGDIPTFMRLPHTRDPAKLDIALIGVPWDGGTTNRAGARHGPREIRNMSSFMRKVHHVSRIAPYELARVGDLGDAPCNPIDLMDSLGKIERFWGTLWRECIESSVFVDLEDARRRAAERSARVGEQVLGQDRRQVLGGRGGADRGADVGALEGLDAAQRPRLPVVDQALLRQMRVEQRVDAPVGGLLPDEGLDRRLEARTLVLGQRLHACAHRVDEELLARRKAHRQRVEPGGAERIAAAPVRVGRRIEVDQQAANDGLGHGTTIPPAHDG